jgi:CubicO group peptidase (beta-lactamase class C family)
MKQLVYLVITLWAASGFWACAPSSDVTSKVDSLFAPFNKTDSPGCVVVVVKNGEVVYKKGFGMANLDYGIPISSTSVFDIASVSKQFAGMAIAMLVEEGKIALTDDIRKYIPSLPDFGKKVTVRHLVDHTSGIRDWAAMMGYAGRDFEDIITYQEILRMAEHQKELNFVPGAEYTYSNTGYVLLAKIVEVVTKQKFADWTQTNIFKPLGMTNTHFHDDHQQIVKNRAVSYYRDDSGKLKMLTDNLTALGSSSLFTTADDLTKWLINLEKGTVGGPKVLALMRKSGVLNNGKPTNYAFGLASGDYHGLARENHTGGWEGFRTILAHFPEQKFGVIILSNLASFNPSGIANKVTDIYLADQFKDKKTSTDKPSVAASTKEVKITPTTFDAYIGSFQLADSSGVVLAFKREGERYFTQATGESQLEIFPSSDSTFFLKAVEAQVTFHRLPNGKVNTMTLHQNGDTQANRVEPFTVPVEQLKQYTGTFYSPELDTRYALVVEKDTLIVKHHRLGKVGACTTRSKDIFTLNGNKVSFVRSSNGQITGFRATSGRVRNLLFEKQQETKP